MNLFYEMAAFMVAGYYIGEFMEWFI